MILSASVGGLLFLEKKTCACRVEAILFFRGKKKGIARKYRRVATSNFMNVFSFLGACKHRERCASRNECLPLFFGGRTGLQFTLENYFFAPFLRSFFLYGDCAGEGGDKMAFRRDFTGHLVLNLIYFFCLLVCAVSLKNEVFNCSFGVVVCKDARSSFARHMLLCGALYRYRP